VGQIHEVGKAAAELVNILRAPKLRGGMGELFLGDLPRRFFPEYLLQHRFKSGEVADAAIGQNLRSACAKFPTKTKRVVEAASESERSGA
jgi:DNA recombination protein RmuC